MPLFGWLGKSLYNQLRRPTSIIDQCGLLGHCTAALFLKYLLLDSSGGGILSSAPTAPLPHPPLPPIRTRTRTRTPLFVSPPSALFIEFPMRHFGNAAIAEIREKWGFRRAARARPARAGGRLAAGESREAL